MVPARGACHHAGQNLTLRGAYFMNPARQRLARTVLEARRTRAGLPPSRLRGLAAFGLLGDAPTLAGGTPQPAVPAKWQVDPAALQTLVKLVTSPAGSVVPQPAILAPASAPVSTSPGAVARSQIPSLLINFRGLGSLGLNQGEKGAAQGAAAGAKAGTVIPVIGTAVGAAVGAIVGYFMSAKHYFNVANADAECQQLLKAWQQYLTIQGHVAGRALGFETVNQLMHAAVGAGLFPGNNMHLSFHQGTLQCAGHGDWVDSFTGFTIEGNPGAACGAHNCLADAYQQYLQTQGQIPPGTPDAIYLVDNILLPMNAPGKAQIPWVYQGAQNGQVHQLLYDLADAYIAQKGGNSTPYVEYPAAQIGAPIANAESAPAAPSILATPAGSAPSSSVPPSAGLPAGWTQIGADPVTGAPILAQAGNPQEYEWVNGQLTPYNPTQVTTAPTPAVGSVPAQPAGTPTTGGMDANTLALIQSMMAQGASQSQAYTQALSQLASQGVNTQSPAVQSQVAQAVENPTGVTAGISTQGFQMSTSTLIMIGGSLLGVYIVTELLEKRKAKKRD